MGYSEIIKENCEKHSSVSWWPKFAFHYTDVTNAVSILDTGYLYSRVNAERMKIMKNDNASRQVIDMTISEAAAHVRFYFRPLTPTQFFNEGYKHIDIRYDNDINANVPVPVFFLFDLERILKMPETKFSEFGQAGYGSPLYSGVEAFSRLDFDKIYSCSTITKELVKYRHAELLYPNFFDINSCLQAVLCRNSIEKMTLMNLLKEKNSTNFYKYKQYIKICRENMFENNGLFITECTFHDNKISISFSDTYPKKYYTERQMRKNQISELPPINAHIEFDWIGKKDTLLYHTVTEFDLDYIRAKSVTFSNLPKINEAKNLRIKLFFDDKLMCYYQQPFADIDLI